MNDIKADPTPPSGFAHDFGCTHNPCRCRETDMNDIDIEEAAQLRARLIAHAHQFDIFGTALAEDLVAAAAMFDAIETGQREVEALRERLAILEDPGTPPAIVGAMFDAAGRLGQSPVASKHALTFPLERIETGQQWETIARQAAPLVARLARVLISVEAQEWLAAFRDVADRTSTPHHDGGAG